MEISLRLSQEDTMLIKSYAALHNISISELFRQSVMEKIEDEYDFQCYEKAMKLYKEDSKTFTLDEVERDLELN